jgi:hypothetical protein
VLDEEGRQILRELRSAVAAQRRREELGCGLAWLAALIVLVAIAIGVVALLRAIF